MIYQMHPTHGRHIAYNSIEADANIKNGWKTVTEAEFYPQKTDNVDDDERAALIELYVEKFGERPHHRSSNATIQAKLDE